MLSIWLWLYGSIGRPTPGNGSLGRAVRVVPWCSGYHICLTHRRSAVRSRPRSGIFLLFFSLHSTGHFSHRKRYLFLLSRSSSSLLALVLFYVVLIYWKAGTFNYYTAMIFILVGGLNFLSICGPFFLKFSEYIPFPFRNLYSTYLPSVYSCSLSLRL